MPIYTYIHHILVDEGVTADRWGVGFFTEHTEVSVHYGVVNPSLGAVQAR